MRQTIAASALRWFVPLFALLVSVGCGDDGGGVAPLTVSLMEPNPDAPQYTTRGVRFEATAATESGDALPEGAVLVYDWDFGDGASSLNVGAEVEHTYDVSGSYEATVTVRADVDGKVVAEGTTSGSFTVFNPADIAIESATLTTDGAVGPNDTFRVSYDVVNDGDSARTPFVVEVYLSEATVDTSVAPTASEFDRLLSSGLLVLVSSEPFVDDGDAATQGANEGIFGAGERALVDLQTLQAPSGLGSGQYGVLIYADGDDALGEIEEDNNAAFADGLLIFEGSATGADLSVTDVLVQPERFNADQGMDSLELDARVVNQGTETATLTNYRVFLSAGDTVLDESDTLLAEESIDALAPDQEIVIDNLVLAIEPPVREIGDYYVIVAVDTEDAVDEASESNNEITSNVVTVTNEVVPGADIVPTSIVVIPEITFLGGSLEVSVEVANTGTDDVPLPFLCRVYLSEDERLDSGPGGDEVLASGTVPALEAGTQEAVIIDAFVPEFVTPGTYFPFVLCDSGSIIAERNEGNNSISAPAIEVAGEADVDLRPESFSVTPLVVENGGTIEISVDVCNVGNNGSTPSVVRVFLSPDPSFDDFDREILASRVPPIEADACLTILAEVAAECDTFIPNYYLFASVDDAGDINESNEENNVGQLDDLLTIEALICACEIDEFEPNDTPAAANFLNPNIGAWEGLTMCQRTGQFFEDYYQIPLLGEQTVRVEARFENDRGNLDLELYALDRATVLDRSETNGDIEVVSSVRVPVRGNYLLRVRGRTEEDRNVYSLDLQISSPDEGTDLTVLDVAVDDLAPFLGAEVEVCFDVVNLGDTPAGPSLSRIYLSDDTRIDPVEDVLMGSLEIEGVTSRLSRCVNVVVPDDLGGGERYIGVLADARNDVPDELDETNNAGLSEALEINATCFDALEPNNSLETPRLVELLTEPPVEFGALLACSDNRDVYEFCLNDGDFLNVGVAFDTLDGDIDMKLYDAAGAQIDRSEGTGETEAVGIDFVNGDQCYRVEIYVAGRDREVPYTMSVDTGRAPDDLICSRIEEPNDDFGTAARLRDFLDDCMAVCPVEDEDFYFVNLSPGTELEVSLVPEPGAEDVPDELRLTLWGPSRNFLTNTVSANETLESTIALTGRHFIRVRSNGDGPRDQGYCLRVEGIEGVDLVPSNFALENDIAAPGDTLRFSFDVGNTRDQASEATDYAVYLSQDPVLDAEADILLRTAELAALEGLESRLEGRRFDVPFDLLDGGEFFVILRVDDQGTVEEFSESNNVIVTPLFVSPRCVPDIAEPNNFPIDARDYGEVAGLPFTSCGIGDDDWFRFTAATPITTVTARFTDALGDLDLYVYDDPLAAPVAFSDTITDDESVEFLSTVGTPYWVLVQQHTDQSTSYTLRVE